MPLAVSRMLATAETFREMTRLIREVANRVAGGRLVLVHEGGYSEAHVPFCGHAVLEDLTGSRHKAPDPFAEALIARQPGPRFDAFVTGLLDEMAAQL